MLIENMNKSLTKPEMIIFDYGHTLLYEPNHSKTNANKAIYKCVAKNTNNISFNEFDRTVNEIFEEVQKKSGNDIEINERSILQLAYEYMGIELSITMKEAEKVIWEGISRGAVMPHIDELIEFLNFIGMRTAVISNICFSGNTLKERINRLLPNNKFEFIMTSSDYVFKKPNSLMFEIAIRKSGVPRDKIWYCGDSIKRDVYGAYNAGMFPVLYEGKTDEDIPRFKNENKEYEIDFDYLHIYDWRELIESLKKCT